MFAYCNNNPVLYRDFSGTTPDTVFDVISLGASVLEVISNPTDVFAWAGLVGDIIDVAVPFVGGIGETVDFARGLIEGTDSLTDAARAIKKYIRKSTGSYEIVFKSGNTYVGKGGFGRAIRSALDKSGQYGDEVISLTWKKASNQRQAFIDEYLSMCKYGGPRSNGNLNTYNQIASPGRNYYYEAFGSYLD